MYSPNDLQIEIGKVIDEMQSVKKLHPDWITQAVMMKHQNIKGDDADFHIFCARCEVRTQVRKRLNSYKADADQGVDKQLVLDGFERLQKRYLIKENGEQVAIRVQDLTQEQLRAKAEEYRVMGAGCYQHADELERYAEQRDSNAAL